MHGTGYLEQELIGLKHELREERAAHRAVKHQLARTLTTIHEYSMRCDELTSRIDDMARARIHPQNPGIPAVSVCGSRSDGSSGDDVSELLLATLGCLARIGEAYVSKDPPPTRAELAVLLGVAHRRLALLTDAVVGPWTPIHPLGEGEGGTTGGEGG